ncbi:MAG: Ig-like domain-containing domain, partial [Terriglobales bacterium]
MTMEFHRRLSVTLLCFLTFAFISCGGGGGSGVTPAPPPPITISVAPSTTDLHVGETAQFTVKPDGTPVIWQVKGIPGGDSTNGTISDQGLYTAPKQVPTPGQVAISAVSQKDASVSAKATVTVHPLVTVSLPAGSLAVTKQMAVSAEVQGTSDSSVDYLINGVQGGTTSTGTITSLGVFTAPLTVPASATVQIGVVSHADPTQQASAPLQLVANTTPPTVLSLTPANAAVGVPLTSSIHLKFSEPLDPTTVGATNFALTKGSTSVPLGSAYDPTTSEITLTPRIVLQPQTSYALAVSSAVTDLTGNHISTLSTSFTTEGLATLQGQLGTIIGTSVSSLNITSVGSAITSPDSAGNFTVQAKPEGVTFVIATVPNHPVGLLGVVAGSTASASQPSRLYAAAQIHGTSRPVRASRWQVTASPQAASASAQVVVDYTTTAESALFLSPFLFTPDPDKARAVLAIIAADPNTAALAAAIKAAAGQPDPFVNSVVRSDYIAAFTSILHAVSSPPPTTRSLSETKHQTSLAASSDTSAPHLSASIRPIDLDYVQIGQPQFDDTGTNIAVSPSVNVLHTVGWLAVPELLPPQVDPNSIQSSQEPNGSAASPIVDGVVEAQPTAWIPASGPWSSLSVSGVLDTLLPGAKADDPTMSLLVSHATNGYLLRFYSGAHGDQWERDNILPQLNNHSRYDTLASVLNYSQVGVDLISGFNVIPNDFESCVFKGIQQRLATEIGDGTLGAPTLSVVGLGQWLGDVFNILYDSTKECLVGDSWWQRAKVIGELAIDLGVDAVAPEISAVLDGLDSGSSLAPAAQRVIEMVKDASPVETAVLTIGSPGARVAEIKVDPPSAHTRISSQLAFTATASDSDGNTLKGVTLTWQLSDQTIASLHTASDTLHATVTGHANGRTIVVVSAPSGATANAVVTVGTGGLHLGSIQTVPVAPVAGQTFAFTATGSNFDPATAQVVFLGPGCQSTCPIVNKNLQITPNQIQGKAKLAAGTFSITVANGDGSVSEPTTLAVVSDTSAVGFSTSVSPSVLHISQGQAGTATVALNSENHFSGLVDLTVLGLPSGISATWSQKTVSLSDGGTASATLSLQVAANVGRSQYPLTVRASNPGELTRDTPLVLSVQSGDAPPELDRIDPATHGPGTFVLDLFGKAFTSGPGLHVHVIGPDFV